MKKLLTAGAILASVLSAPAMANIDYFACTKLADNADYMGYVATFSMSQGEGAWTIDGNTFAFTPEQTAKDEHDFKTADGKTSLYVADSSGKTYPDGVYQWNQDLEVTRAGKISHYHCEQLHEMDIKTGQIY